MSISRNMSIKKPLLIGIGELLWDVLPSGKKLGGATANFAFHVMQLGGKGSIISAVGNDDDGNEIIELLKKKGMDTALISRLDLFPTGTVNVEIDQNGIPTYNIHTEVAWDYIPYKKSWKSRLAIASAICFGSLAQRSTVSAQTIHQVLKLVPYNCLKILDINLRQNFFTKEVIEQSLYCADILKLNEDELQVIAKMANLRGTDEEKLSTILDRFSVKLIALTKGGQGSLLFTHEEKSWLESPKVKIADTVGAGDSFTAAMTMGLLNGWPLVKVHQNAVRVSAYVCTQSGAMPELPETIIFDFLIFE